MRKNLELAYLKKMVRNDLAIHKMVLSCQSYNTSSLAELSKATCYYSRALVVLEVGG